MPPPPPPPPQAVREIMSAAKASPIAGLAWLRCSIGGPSLSWTSHHRNAGLPVGLDARGPTDDHSLRRTDRDEYPLVKHGLRV